MQRCNRLDCSPGSGADERPIGILKLLKPPSVRLLSIVTLRVNIVFDGPDGG
jgi:hypothetical protein